MPEAWPVPDDAVESTSSLLAYLAAHDAHLGASHRPLRAGLAGALHAGVARGADVHELVLDAVEELTRHATSPTGSPASSPADSSSVASPSALPSSSRAIRCCALLLDSLARADAPRPSIAVAARASQLSRLHPEHFRRLAKAFPRARDGDGSAAREAARILWARGSLTEAALLVCDYGDGRADGHDAAGPNNGIDVAEMIEVLVADGQSTTALRLAGKDARMQLCLVTSLMARGDGVLASRYLHKFELRASAPRALLRTIACDEIKRRVRAAMTAANTRGPQQHQRARVRWRAGGVARERASLRPHRRVLRRDIRRDLH